MPNSLKFMKNTKKVQERTKKNVKNQNQCDDGELVSRLFAILWEHLRAYIATLRRDKITRIQDYKQGKRRQCYTTLMRNR